MPSPVAASLPGRRPAVTVAMPPVQAVSAATAPSARSGHRSRQLRDRRRARRRRRGRQRCRHGRCRRLRGGVRDVPTARPKAVPPVATAVRGRYVEYRWHRCCRPSFGRVTPARPQAAPDWAAMAETPRTAARAATAPPAVFFASIVGSTADGEGTGGSGGNADGAGSLGGNGQGGRPGAASSTTPDPMRIPAVLPRERRSAATAATQLAPGARAATAAAESSWSARASSMFRW